MVTAQVDKAAAVENAGDLDASLAEHWPKRAPFVLAADAGGGYSFFDDANHDAVQKEYGLSVEDVHHVLKQRLPPGAKTTLAKTRQLVRDHGANNFGRVSRCVVTKQSVESH